MTAQDSAHASSDLDLLKHYLSVREEHCPSCSYNLHNLTNDSCPECGEPLKLQVALQTPKLAAFITGLIALSISAGFPILFAAMALIAFTANGYYPRKMLYFFSGLVLLSLLNSSFTFVWCRFKATLIRRTSRFRWPVAIISWLLCPITMFIAYIILELFE
ncbi:hypothetical protein KS4_03870 [Poriferisphaera corsica]|uniref:Zinc ribbon domain-containing protein n=1 Tax=Poriferisphaera corsica TaxID=2528020 RepID=A0A517YQ53_9BACT|nr:hypothetical protein [Poriferisphaera corsica]QDU32355.1 hypothetical protein KS4_03870 [Poriferisphaera corsica]